MKKLLTLLLFTTCTLFSAPKKGYLGFSAGYAPETGIFAKEYMNTDMSHGGNLTVEYTRALREFYKIGGSVGSQLATRYSDSTKSGEELDLSFSIENRHLFYPLYKRGNKQLELNADLGFHFLGLNKLDEYVKPQYIEDPSSPGDTITVIVSDAGSIQLRSSISTGVAYHFKSTKSLALGTFFNYQMIGITREALNRFIAGVKFTLHQKS